MTAPQRVLTVCTANVCRSPVAQRLLGDALGTHVLVQSAGVKARDGLEQCPEARAWLEELYHPAGRSRHAHEAQQHRSRRVRADMVTDAGLVLTATRDHRASVIRLVPAAQRYTFTLLQAARIARWQHGQGLTAPTDRDARLPWLATVLDAGRMDAPRPEDPADDDLPDPHYGEAAHEQLLPDLLEAVTALALLTSTVAREAAVQGPAV